ncbi:hypothetical protein ACQ4PT_056700 [Festuca glaucescens]
MERGEIKESVCIPVMKKLEGYGSVGIAKCPDDTVQRHHHQKWTGKRNRRDKPKPNEFLFLADVIEFNFFSNVHAISAEVLSIAGSVTYKTASLASGCVEVIASLAVTAIDLGGNICLTPRKDVSLTAEAAAEAWLVVVCIGLILTDVWLLIVHASTVDPLAAATASDPLGDAVDSLATQAAYNPLAAVVDPFFFLDLSVAVLWAHAAALPGALNGDLNGAVVDLNVVDVGAFNVFWAADVALVRSDALDADVVDVLPGALKGN